MLKPFILVEEHLVYCQLMNYKLLISEVYKNYKVVENPEITFEANPDDLYLFESVRIIFEDYKNIAN